MHHVQDCMTSGDITVELFQKIDSKWKDQLYPILKSLNQDINNFKKAMTSAKNRIVLFQFHQALLEYLINLLDQKFEGMFCVAIFLNYLCVL